MPSVPGNPDQDEAVSEKEDKSEDMTEGKKGKIPSLTPDLKHGGGCIMVCYLAVIEETTHWHLYEEFLQQNVTVAGSFLMQRDEMKWNKQVNEQNGLKRKSVLWNGQVGVQI